MVQRKVPSKLSIQGDRIKSKNQSMVNLRSPSSLQHHDRVKNNRGADLRTKKMKKSGSIKRPEIAGVCSPNLRRHVRQPGKPPPLEAASTPPQAQKRAPPVSSTTATTPNYMRGTTSSDARKEQTQQVSLKSPQTSPDCSSVTRKRSCNSKFTLSFGNKAIKTTSLKMMRTLTKNPSFKPARAKKCSPVVLCEDIDVQRATCSSTLKDCKFPAYLELNRGGSEADGASAVKVCPYTYCSLNGHHHAPLPPLKCFLSARRRMIKNQRSIKLGCLSPRRVKPIGDSPYEKLTAQEDLESSVTPFFTNEEKTEFFVEIYSKEKEDNEERIEERDERAEEAHDKQVLEKHEMVSCDVDAHETLDLNKDDDQVDYSPSVVEEEGKVGFLSERDSEASDMDWEREYYSALYLDDDDDAYEYSPVTEVQLDMEGCEVEKQILYEEPVTKADNKGDCVDEFLEPDEVSQESFDEDSLSSDAFSSSSDSESIDSYGYTESLDSVKTSDPEELKPEGKFQNQDQLEEECNQPENFEAPSPTDLQEDPSSDAFLLNSAESEPDMVTKGQAKNASQHEVEDSSLNRAIAKGKKLLQDEDELEKHFNPRAPNFLPIEPDPDAEKVDLRHQELDEKKNAEEWMVDYALRQAVTKLGSARKRKVALLVEAFEKVIPTTKCELHQRRISAFNQARPVQACN